MSAPFAVSEIDWTLNLDCVRLTYNYRLQEDIDACEH